MKKVVAKRDLHDPSATQRDLEYWLSRTPDERIEAVEILRRQHYGTIPPLQFCRVGRLAHHFLTKAPMTELVAAALQKK